MTAPIDIDCPACSATAGNYCVARGDRAEGMPTPNWREVKISFHHAARVDTAARVSDRHRTQDPTRLRSALEEALDRWEIYATYESGEKVRIAALREEFDLPKKEGDEE